VPGEGSYFSRLAVKFVEIFAAGVATAVSGFVIAHLGGFLISPSTSPTAPAANTPSVVQTVPTAPNTAVNPQPAAPAAAAAKPETRSETKSDTAPAQPVGQSAASAAVPSAAPALRKPAPAEGATAETRPEARPEIKPREEVASRPRDEVKLDSLEARVRAALGKASAGHPAPAEAPRRQPEAPSGALLSTLRVENPHAADLAPAPLTTLPAAPPSQLLPAPISAPAAGAAPTAIRAPRPANTTPVAAPQAPPPLAPPTTVEIKSQPIAGVDAAQAQPAQTAQTDDKSADNNPFSAFARFLRSDKPLPADLAPRPPMPVGQ
jgi:hypothetical protein